MWLGEMNNRITIVDSNPAVSVRPAALRPCFAAGLVFTSVSLG